MTAPFSMGRIGRHGLVYGLGAVAGKAVAFLMLPIYTRFLTPADYGVLQLIDMALDVISIFAGSRLAAGIFHYYHKADTERERKQVLSTAFIIMITAFGVAGAVTYVSVVPLTTIMFGNAEHADLMRIAATTMALSSLIVVPTALLQVKERSGLFVTVSLVKLLLQVGLNILFVVGFRMGAKGVLLSGLIVQVVVGFALGVMFVRNVGWAFSTTASRTLVRFGLPFVGAQVATFIATFGDRYFLRVITDISTVGLYALAYQFGFLLTTLGYMPYNIIWEPVRFEIARRDDRDSIYRRAFVHFNLLLITVALFLAVFVQDLLVIMAAPPFWDAAKVVPIILVAYVLQGWTGFHNLGIMYREKTGLIAAANWVGAFVALAGYTILIPPLHAYGAALATVLSFGTRQWLIYRWSQKLWYIDYNWPPVVRLVSVAVAIVVIDTLVPQLDLWKSIIFHSILATAYLVAIWRAGILESSDRDWVRSVVANPRVMFQVFRSEQ